MPFNQRPQSGLPPQHRAPGPSSVNTSHVNPASVSGQRWPPQGIHLQGAPIAAQPQTNISITGNQLESHSLEPTCNFFYLFQSNHLSHL